LKYGLACVALILIIVALIRWLGWA
jgi:hypothetical protein